MEKIVYTLLILFSFLLYSCEKPADGNLHTENAEYRENPVHFKTKLNPADAEDARRIKNKAPWVSGSIEGVLGTPIVHYSIHKISTDNDMDIEARNQFSMHAGGVVHLPYDHTLPEGSYWFGVRIENDGHCVVIDSVLNIILDPYKENE